MIQKSTKCQWLVICMHASSEKTLLHAPSTSSELLKHPACQGLACVFVHCFAVLINCFLLFLYSSEMACSTASSGTGSIISCRTYSSAAAILELGFHSPSFRNPRHIVPFPSLVTFGWYIFVFQLITGGLNGYSLGSVTCTRNFPPYAEFQR